VAKEYVAAQDPNDPGVLILSLFAGAANQLQSALLVNPSDPESVASALYRALTMPLEERRARHRTLYASICKYDVDRWQRQFLTALQGLPERENLQSVPFGRELTTEEVGEGAKLDDKLAKLRQVLEAENNATIEQIGAK
jgi:trehalose-6-phosphate synthase